MFYTTDETGKITAAAETKFSDDALETDKTIVYADGALVFEDDPSVFESQKTAAYDKLWSNYKTFQETYVDAEDLTLAVVCASKGSAKGAAVQMWVMGLWAQYYVVKDQIAAAQSEEALAAIDLTADSFGAPPYTIRELNEEAAAALANSTEDNA